MLTRRVPRPSGWVVAEAAVVAIVEIVAAAAVVAGVETAISQHFFPGQFHGTACDNRTLGVSLVLP